MNAYVPQNYSRKDDLCILHSNFVKSIIDSKYLVTDQMIKKTIKVIVVRKKANIIPWEVEKILEVLT